MTILGMGVIELIAVGFGIACVVLTIFRNIWCWPTGLFMVGLYVHIFFQAKLYSDMGLQVVYVLLQVYGWHQWLHGGDQGDRLPLSRLSVRARLLWLGVGLAGTLGLGVTMHLFTDASLPYWDAATTAFSLVAQWLLARKVIENWVFWIAVDVMAIGVYLAKGLYPTTVLYGVFLILATLGLLTWIKTYRNNLSDPGMALS